MVNCVYLFTEAEMSLKTCRSFRSGGAASATFAVSAAAARFITIVRSMAPSFVRRSGRTLVSDRGQHAGRPLCTGGAKAVPVEHDENDAKPMWKRNRRQIVVLAAGRAYL